MVTQKSSCFVCANSSPLSISPFDGRIQLSPCASLCTTFSSSSLDDLRHNCGIFLYDRYAQWWNTCVDQMERFGSRKGKSYDSTIFLCSWKSEKSIWYTGCGTNFRRFVLAITFDWEEHSPRFWAYLKALLLPFFLVIILFSIDMNYSKNFYSKQESNFFEEITG